MHLDTLLSMGGYGLYVWTAYSITFAVFGLNVFWSLRERKHIRNRLQHRSP